MESQDNQLGREGQLFIVATPIGNLGDITYRAVELLKSVEVIAVEDTRVSGKLLSRYAIQTPMLVCHEHNEEKAAQKIMPYLESGKSVALISDAGTPLINDPGYRLINLVRKAGFGVVPIPGASSPIAALCASGMPTDQFTYAGFFPRSGSARSDMIAVLKSAPHTYLFLESPHRLVKSLESMASSGLSDREICVARELTKLHESLINGSVVEVLAHYREHSPKGEIVLVVAPATEKGEVSDEDILVELDQEAMLALSPSKRAGAVAKALHVPKSRVYPLLNHDQD